MARRKKYYITTKYKSCPKWDRWFTKLEMRCFGWFYNGLETEMMDIIDVDIDWDTGKGTASRRFYEWITFKRVKPYTGNLLSKLCELVMGIVSWIRRTFVGLISSLLVIGFLLGGAIGSIEEVTPILMIGVGIIVVIYAASAAIAILGFAIRHLFGIERRLKKSLAKNGYTTDLDE